MNKDDKPQDLTVINLWGGQGAGKSTIMAGLFFELRRRGLRAEMIPFVKHEGTALLDFAHHHSKISSQRGKHEFVITDFPLPLGIYRDETKNINFRGLVMDLWKDGCINLNFYIEREPGGKVPEEWLKEDKDLKNILVSSSIPFTPVPSRDPIPVILDAISEYKCREKILKEEGLDSTSYSLDTSEE